jgi:hypothetical protein
MVDDKMLFKEVELRGHALSPASEYWCRIRVWEIALTLIVFALQRSVTAAHCCA